MMLTHWQPPLLSAFAVVRTALCVFRRSTASIPVSWCQWHAGRVCDLSQAIHKGDEREIPGALG
jgi:hypothetical protein